MINVSFIIAAYNVENYIERCIYSIISNKENIEVIVVNDGSTDNTLCKVENMIKDDKRIKIINQENKGLLEARKTGLLQAKGEYVVFIDGDDWIENGLVRKGYELAKTAGVDILIYNAYLSFENGDKKIYENRKYNEYDDLLKLTLLDDINHNIWNRMIRNDFINKDEFVLLPSLTMGEDFVINSFLVKSNPKVKIIDEPLYNYFIRNDSVTKKSNPRMLEIVKTLNYLEESVNISSLENKNEINSFLWYKYCFYLRIVTPRYKRTEVEKELYHIWKKRNEKIKNNNMYKLFIKNERIINKFLNNVFMTNYFLGSCAINIICIIKNVKEFIRKR